MIAKPSVCVRSMCGASARLRSHDATGEAIERDLPIAVKPPIDTRITAPTLFLSAQYLNRRGTMAKKSKKIATRRRLFTKQDIKALRAHSKARTPVAKISKELKRSVGSIRQKALKLGFGLGHKR